MTDSADEGGEGGEDGEVADLAKRLRSAAAERAAQLRLLKEEDLELATLNEFTLLNNELVGLQRELTQRNAELAAMNAWKVRFLGMVAHDLRGPLTAIHGFAQLLVIKSADLLPAGQLAMVKEIVSSAERQARMIDDLMDASAIEAGQFIMRMRDDVDLASIIVVAKEAHRLQAEEKGIELLLDIQPGCPPLHQADVDKLRQLFSNLISNALKYSHPDTTVTVSLVADGSGLTIAVADEGQGMGPEDLDKLFKEYGTTSVKSTGGEKSTGLGLNIVKAIVEGHGGTIEVASEVGVGTTFTVHLPFDGPQLDG